MTTGWTIEAILGEIDEARKTGDHNYEDKMLLKLDEAVREPKKLIIFREHSLGGALYNISSNVEFSEVIAVDSTSESTAGQDAADYDEVQTLAVDGDYGSAAWHMSLERVEERLAHWKKRMKELELKREED